MARLAGRIADGYHVHPFHTTRYLKEVTLPAMAEGARAGGRSPDSITLASSVMVVTGRDSGELAIMRDRVRRQIAFYASTPVYRRVLEVHGWDFGSHLTRLSKRGEWRKMPEVVSDEVVSAVAVEAPLDSLGEALRTRYQGLVDRLGFYALDGGPPALAGDALARVLAAVQG